MSSGHVAHEGQHAAPSNAQLLSSILLDIGASDYLQKFIDEEQDDDCIPSYKKPDMISRNYGLPSSLASAFVEKCRAKAGALRAGDFASISMSSSGPPPQTGAASAPVDADSAMREMKLEMVRELGKGGFGTVFLCKNPADKLYVAVKLVNDPKHAKEAMREGQRLRMPRQVRVRARAHVCAAARGAPSLECNADPPLHCTAPPPCRTAPPGRALRCVVGALATACGMRHACAAAARARCSTRPVSPEAHLTGKVW